MRELNFTILAVTTYDGYPEPLSVSSDACFVFLEPRFNITEVVDVLLLLVIVFIGIIIGSCMTIILIAIFVLTSKRKKPTVAPALVAAIMGRVSVVTILLL